mmetsp:Transcript_26065/g.35926  ORF Transcript_26065/g.35926 Transcript_26065/m.35926 type:complete len:167 (+) Transcript_26065:218-718(+)
MNLIGEYSGDQENGRYHGKGVYKLENARYEGNFRNGEFHGEGRMFVEGGSFQGIWRQGKLVEGCFVFKDDLKHKRVEDKKEWDYCTSSDPRFYNEILEGVKVGDKLRHQSAHRYATSLPKGCYDTIDGYFDPKKHTVFSYDNNEELRIPDKREIDWIKEHCRIGLD